jgi:hypothetical protein
MRRTKAQRIGAIVTVVSVMSLAGWATAAWLVDAPITGYAKAGSLAAPTTLDISATVPGELVPGGTAAARFQIVNPNSVPINLIGYDGTNVFTVTGSCNAANITFGNKTGLSLTVPASNGPNGTLVAVPAAVSMDANAETACQGAVFRLTATGHFST